MAIVATLTIQTTSHMGVHSSFHNAAFDDMDAAQETLQKLRVIIERNAEHGFVRNHGSGRYLEINYAAGVLLLITDEIRSVNFVDWAINEAVVASTKGRYPLTFKTDEKELPAASTVSQHGSS